MVKVNIGSLENIKCSIENLFFSHIVSFKELRLADVMRSSCGSIRDISASTEAEASVTAAAGVDCSARLETVKYTPGLRSFVRTAS
jgi:hypothetical protein